MIDKNTTFNVYNEYNGDIYGVSAFNDFGYKFERANEYGEPSITPVQWSDIVLMNNKSSVFRTGTLRFDPNDEEEVYKELRITPNHDYLTKAEIEDIILNTSTEKLEKLLEIRSMNTIEKVRTVLVGLDNSGEYDIPVRVFDVVNARIYEISKGKIKTEIKLVVKKNAKPVEEVQISNESESETEKKVTTRKTK